MTSSPDELVAQSSLVESTDSASTLDPEAAGCVQQESSDMGQANNLPQAGDASTDSAAPAAVDVGTDRPKPPQTMREFERALRGLGYSQRQAAQISRHGLKAGAEALDDESAALNALGDALKRNLAAMKANHE